MKVLEAIKQLNEVEKEDGSSLLADKVDLAELKKAKEVDQDEAFMKAVESIPASDEGDLPEELAEFYNLLRDKEEKKEEEKVEPKIEVETKIKKEGKIEAAKGKELTTQIKNEVEESKFNLNNCPSGYNELKLEVKELVVSTAKSILLLGQRLKVIHDDELYKEDGYADFKSFIAEEIKISRQSAYNAMDLITYFGVKALLHANLVDPTKLIPALPLLRVSDEQISKENKKELISILVKESKIKTYREMSADIKNMKIKYGLITEIKKDLDNPWENACKKLFSTIPEKLTKTHVRQIEKLVIKLNELIILT